MVAFKWWNGGVLVGLCSYTDREILEREREIKIDER